jgi:hypothetical protein
LGALRKPGEKRLAKPAEWISIPARCGNFHSQGSRGNGPSVGAEGWGRVVRKLQKEEAKNFEMKQYLEGKQNRKSESLRAKRRDERRDDQAESVGRCATTPAQ